MLLRRAPTRICGLSAGMASSRFSPPRLLAGRGRGVGLSPPSTAVKGLIDVAESPTPAPPRKERGGEQAAGLTDASHASQTLPPCPRASPISASCLAPAPGRAAG